MNIIICDDDQNFAQDLMKLINATLRECSLSASFEIFNSGLDFIEWYQTELTLRTPIINFLFIDIKMPGYNGLETLKKFREFDKQCITFIVSNYSNYVFDSFESEPFDFIVKPINNNKFKLAFQRGIEKYKKKCKKIIIYGNHKHISLSYNEIISIETSNRSLIIHSVHGDYIVMEKLSDFEAKLKPYGFLKTHKSYIINMDKVLYYQGNQFFLLNGFTADISYRKRSIIINEFNNYILKQKI